MSEYLEKIVSAMRAVEEEEKDPLSAAARMVADIFGYVCTFENRCPVFHKI